MEKELIFSENPEVDIWINIKQYASHIRIKQVLEKKGFSVEDALINAISGSISQALEYFEASKTVSLQTAPLLVYYGTTNLFYGFSCLLKGEKINVTNGHGLGIFNKDSSDIFDISAKIGKRNGGFSLYLKSLTNTDSNPNDNWSIRELLSSIPEVQSEFIKIFGEEESSIIYLEEVLEEGFGSTFFVKSKLDNELIMDKLREIKNFDEYFITPNFSGSKIRLNKRLDKNQAIIESTYSNEKYLVSLKNKSQIDNFFKYFILLYILAYICRYNPEKWIPYVNENANGEVTILEKFLQVSRRYIPNFILDLTENKQHIYSNNLTQPTDLRESIFSEELEEKIRKIMNKY